MAVSDVLAVLACVVLVAVLYQRNRNLPYPPGPRPLPIIGNMLDRPVKYEYLKYTQWGAEYGDVVHINTFGKHLVILNSITAANDLLDGRSAIYSDRPYMPMMHDPLLGMNQSFVFKRYTPEWRRQRRLFTRYLGPVASRAFSDTLTASAHTLLRSMLQSPEDVATHLRYTAAESILSIAYGYQIKPKDDPLVELIENRAKVISQASVPGRFLVNTLPWLRYIPAWFPGAEFQKFVAKGREVERKIMSAMHQYSKRRIADGSALPSFMTNALIDSPSDDLNLDIHGVATAMYGAGTDTTLSSVESCVLSLILNPAMQQRAQNELDTVLGPVTCPTFRLPTVADRPYLPYIDAIVKESLRWLTVAPIGASHATTKEDVYRGWRIPRNATIIANAWAMLHSEEEYPQPFVFRPERFLGDNPAPHPGTRGCFGFGRRECPGRNLAEESVWLQIACLLAVFTLSPGKDQDGRDIDVSYACNPSTGLVLHPQKFPCRVTLRSKEAEMRIHETRPEVQQWSEKWLPA